MQRDCDSLPFMIAAACSLSIVLLAPLPLHAQGNGEVHVCTNPAGQMRRVAADEPCRPNEIRVVLSEAGAGGGGTLVGQRTGHVETIIVIPAFWTLLADSVFLGTTNGGPLLITVNVPLFASSPSHSACRPTVDGQWAGSFAALSPPAVVWHEGQILTSSSGIRGWSVARAYPNIPSGEHIFAVECATDTPNPVFASGPNLPLSIGVVELAPQP